MKTDLGTQSQYTEEVHLPQQGLLPALPSKSVGVLSSLPESGKTSLAINQAQQLPQEQRTSFLQKAGVSPQDPWLTYSGITGATPQQQQKAKEDLHIGMQVQPAATTGATTGAAPFFGAQLSDPSKYGFFNNPLFSKVSGPNWQANYKTAVDMANKGADPTKVRDYLTKNFLLQYWAQESQKMFSKYAKGTLGYGATPFGGGAPLHAKQQKAAAATPGAGLWGLGIDPKDPDAELKARAYMASYLSQMGQPPNGFPPGGKVYNSAGQEIVWMRDGTFGRSDAPMKGFFALRREHPNASYAQLMDYAYREQFAQNALPPRSFDIMSIIDPLVELGLTATGFGAPAAVAYGAGRGLSEGGLLGGLMGGLGAYGIGTGSPWSVGTSIASGIGRQINPDLGTALGLAGGLGQGLTGGGWKNLVGPAAGQVAGAFTNDPYMKLLASLGGSALAPGAPNASTSPGMLAALQNALKGINP